LPSPIGNLTIYGGVIIGSKTFNWNVRTTGSCADVSPESGTLCSDGSMYVGRSVLTGAKMYTTPCVYGMTWNGSSCTGSAVGLPWALGGTILTTATSFNDGETNTATLVGLSNADSPYVIARYCQTLNAHGQTDWYLPSLGEAVQMRSGCNVIPSVSCTSNSSYATSTDLTTTNYQGVRHDQGGGTSLGKTTSRAFRCVRKD
jgi:hypothetical protein